MSVAFRSSKRRRRLMVLLKDWSLIIVMKKNVFTILYHNKLTKTYSSPSSTYSGAGTLTSQHSKLFSSRIRLKSTLDIVSCASKQTMIR